MAGLIGCLRPCAWIGGAKRVAAGAAYFSQAHCKAAHRAILNIVIAAAEAGAPGAFTICIGLAAIRIEDESHCEQSEQGSSVHVILRNVCGWKWLIQGKAPAGKDGDKFLPGPRLRAVRSRGLIKLRHEASLNSEHAGQDILIVCTERSGRDDSVG